MKTNKKNKSKKPKVSDVVKAYVDMKLDATVEDKLNDYGITTNIGNTYVSPNLQCSPLFLHPNVQDATSNGRVGNRIQVKKLKLNYIMWPSPFDMTANPEPRPQEVILWFCRLKRSKTEIPTSVDVSRFFSMGGAALPPVGDIRDCISVVNQDLFTVFAIRRHKVAPASFIGDSSINPKPYQYWTNNDFKYNVQSSIDLTRHMTKNQVYDDVQPAPTGSSLGSSQVYMLTTTVNADGTLLTSPNIAPVQFYYWVECRYEDA